VLDDGSAEGQLFIQSDSLIQDYLRLSETYVSFFKKLFLSYLFR